MVSVAQLGVFALTAFALIVVPGPSVLFVVTRGLILGRRGAFATVIGNAAGEAAQIVAVAFGLGALVERSIVVFMVLKLLGAAYLIYLGVQAIRHRRSLGGILEAPSGPRSTGRVLREGFVVGVSNPKSLVFFAAVLPQFANPTAGGVPLQLLTLGAVFVLIALVSDSVWALAATRARSWFESSPGRLSTLGGIGGVVMIGIGARLAVSGRAD
jgi:threonine/homoserine/homoserine lactone efflux protein